MNTGLFLSLDGIDGCGKSTQGRLLAEWFVERDHKVVTCCDPGSTALGERLRELLLGSQSVSISRRAEMLLYMASRAQLVEEIIKPALESGQTVIADRFLLANVAYQGYGGGLNVDSLWEVGRVATDALVPDLTFVLDLEPHLAAQRRAGNPDRLEREPADFHQRVREGFLAEAKKQAEAIRVIDATGPIEQVQRCLQSEVEMYLAGQGGKKQPC